jgi:hypothetical protein
MHIFRKFRMFFSAAFWRELAIYTLISNVWGLSPTLRNAGYYNLKQGF